MIKILADRGMGKTNSLLYLAYDILSHQKYTNVVIITKAFRNDKALREELIELRKWTPEKAEKVSVISPNKFNFLPHGFPETTAILIDEVDDFLTCLSKNIVGYSGSLTDKARDWWM